MSKMKDMFGAFGSFFLPLDPADTEAFKALSNGHAQARAVETELEKATGIKPSVSFDWKNGRLGTVTAIFPQFDETRPMRDWTTAVRAAVRHQFRRPVGNIVVGFSLGTA